MRVLLLAVLLLLPQAVAAQNPSGTNGATVNRVERPSSVDGPDGGGSSPQDINLPAEMRVRLAIERAEGQHRKMLEDVRKMSDISTSVAERFHRQGNLSPDDLKQIGTVEKLAKRILSHAGGKEVDEKEGEQKFPTLPEAIDGMSAAASKVKESLTMQTRHVISAMVIASSNEVINFAQFIRRTLKPND